MLGFHRSLNRETANNWASFASHRQRVTELLTTMTTTATSGGTLAILGAGNCNDLVLDDIVARFAQVHLFDIDREALGRGRDRQSSAVAERLVLHAPVDLGGALADVAKFRRRAASRDELGALPQAGTRQVLAAEPERFDAVASTCILSQLVHGCQRLLGDEHPQIQEIACAVVVAHLRIVAQLVKPGGTGLIVTDTVSSDTYPLVELWGQQAPWSLIDQLEATGNHLSGTTPKFLRRVINTDLIIAPLVVSSELKEPWLWNLSADETYLVYALAFQRRL